MENTHILMVDDDEDILVAGKLLLKRHYVQIIRATRCEGSCHDRCKTF
jgi:hypothetical protein